MNECNQKLQELVQNSALTAVDKQLWSAVFNIPDDLCPDILAFVEASPEALLYMTDNLKRKFQALKYGNVEKWDALLEEDASIIGGSLNNKK